MLEGRGPGNSRTPHGRCLPGRPAGSRVQEPHAKRNGLRSAGTHPRIDACPEARAALAPVMGVASTSHPSRSPERGVSRARQAPWRPASPAAACCRAHAAVANGSAAVSQTRSGPAWPAVLVVTLLLATSQLRRGAHDDAAARRDHHGDARRGGDRRPHRKVTLKSRAWDDEDARLLATAFNTLTESIARFQREAAQKERLSSLGRLSTVIAHEIRNPLMIIRASLRRCGAAALTAASSAKPSPTSTTKRSG